MYVESLSGHYTDHINGTSSSDIHTQALTNILQALRSSLPDRNTFNKSHATLLTSYII